MFEPSTVHDFVLRGFVDELPTAAHWRSGHLDADPELIRRAQVVVAMGECAFTGDGSRIIPAALDGDGIAVLLTLVRAFTRITAATVKLQDPSVNQDGRHRQDDVAFPLQA